MKAANKALFQPLLKPGDLETWTDGPARRRGGLDRTRLRPRKSVQPCRMASRRHLCPPLGFARHRRLEGVLPFYRDTLGLVARRPDARTLTLHGSATAPAVITFTENPAAVAPAERVAGLFHLALLVPDRPTSRPCSPA